MSLSPGILVVARDSRCRKDCHCRKRRILRGIVAVLAVVGIVAVARDCRCRKIFSLSEGILAVARDSRCRKGAWDSRRDSRCRQGLSLSPGIVAVGSYSRCRWGSWTCLPHGHARRHMDMHWDNMDMRWGTRTRSPHWSTVMGDGPGKLVSLVTISVSG